jgi:hypothetical protein
MAIVGAYPILATPAAVVDGETRTLAFRNLDGSAFFDCTGREFAGMDGIEGIDLPPVDAIEDRIPGMHGDRLLSMRYASRDITLPLWLRSDSGHRDFLAKRGQLQDLFDFGDVDYQYEGGTFDLVSNSVDGNHERSLRVRYVGGMEGNLTKKTDQMTWALLPLKLRSVRPFWRGDEWRTPDVRVPLGVSFFKRFPGRLSNDRALGSAITVTVPGSARSWPQVNVVGPSSAVQITGPNMYISVPGGLDDNEVCVIETDPELRSDGTMFNGDPDWSRVAPNCVFGSGLRPGDNTFTIDVGAGSSSTVAWVSGVSQWKAPW